MPGPQDYCFAALGNATELRQTPRAMHKAKIVTVGPMEGGKTYISNFLADATESSGGEYSPTKGARVLEFDAEGGHGFTRTEIELWDCSGDKKFENCWPAIWQDTVGVLVVYNPSMHQQERELDHWINFFVTQQGLGHDRALVVANSRITQDISAQVQKPGRLPKDMAWMHIDGKEALEGFRTMFSTFASQIVKLTASKQRSDEDGIMSGRM